MTTGELKLRSTRRSVASTLSSPRQVIKRFHMTDGQHMRAVRYEQSEGMLCCSQAGLD